MTRKTTTQPAAAGVEISLTADDLAVAYEPLPDGYLEIIRGDDGRIPKGQKLADPTRVLWDRHCLLAEVYRLRGGAQ